MRNATFRAALRETGNGRGRWAVAGLGCWMLLAAPVLALEARGVVDLGTGVGFCGADYFVIDPCSGERTWIHGDVYLLVNLGQFVCDHVEVTGPDVGVECVEIGIQTFESTAPTCAVQVPDLRLAADSYYLTLRWKGLACVDGYDVVRGSLAALSPGRLGTVTCVAQNVTTPQKILGGEPDPPAGEGYFYLVRAVGGEWGFEHYGHGSDGAPRFPDAGDCGGDVFQKRVSGTGTGRVARP